VWQRRRRPGPDAVRALINAAPDRYKGSYGWLLLQAAFGRASCLAVALVDLPRGKAQVKQQLIVLIVPDKESHYLGEPKTIESYRTLPLA
jgi:hypothetical protein